MFKFWKSKSPFKTIRAEDLLVGDKFVWDYPVQVKEIQAFDAHSSHVTIEYITNGQPQIPPRIETVQIYRELLITVVR